MNVPVHTDAESTDARGHPREPCAQGCVLRRGRGRRGPQPRATCPRRRADRGTAVRPRSSYQTRSVSALRRRRRSRRSRQDRCASPRSTSQRAVRPNTSSGPVTSSTCTSGKATTTMWRRGARRDADATVTGAVRRAMPQHRAPSHGSGKDNVPTFAAIGIKAHCSRPKAQAAQRLFLVDGLGPDRRFRSSTCRRAARGARPRSRGR